ncbi:MAG: hypothetical protein KKB51_17140 [Candidatus Riflebacteria bacterium]|nr:hypothetical protein [Candidatus Riflebacteria bacterium]
MSRVIAAALVMTMMVLAPAFANWELPFGKEVAAVGITAPVGAEDFPVGPASYRIVGDNLWVLDSAKGRVLCFDAASKLLKEIAIPGLPEKYILDDFAMQFTGKDADQPSAIIVIEAMDRLIIKFSLDGKQLFKVKSDSLIQLDEVDIDSTGQFYVGDYAKSLLAVFSADGKMLREISWQSSGFVVDSDNNLNMINYVDEVGHFYVKLAADGQELVRVKLGLPEMQNPRIWHVNSKGEFLVSFIPPEGDPSSQALYTYSAKCEILKKVVFKNPYYVKRYLTAGKESAWLVDADYNKAPDQPIKFKQL